MTWAWGAKPVDSQDAEGLQRQAEFDEWRRFRAYCDGKYPVGEPDPPRPVICAECGVATPGQPYCEPCMEEYKRVNRLEG